MHPNFLRSYLRHVTLNILGSFAKPAKGIHILNGHMISRKNPSIEIFLSQLQQLQKISTFIRIEDAVKLITNQAKVDDTLIAFTFDDGFDECATMIAPALEQFNTNAAFFINPNFVEGNDEYIRHFTENIVFTPHKKPMRWNQIIDLQQKGHIIGAHTMDHYMINDSDIEKLEYQIATCKDVIEQKTGSPCEYFAFPYGRLEHANIHSIDIAAKYYKYLFSQSDYKHYFSFNGKVINRRHFEPDWSLPHVCYFISHPKSY